ncbi:transglutaminase-like domain-containing protein [Prevotella sp. 10(H)]|uniref:transglutaminase-like domain-containing protein n=1 Tax=Prevotella sp. 10(H) TaxID=1158294 RepID=UPI0004A6DEEE|nr:transglutaminase-like domain-containing protein [Prevotella sp. 10(H)]
MPNKIYLILLSFVIFLYSCSLKENRLENAIKQAKENKPELEKVLKHYSENIEDSLKYKAACFLIENMPGHLSIKDTLTIIAYYNEIDSLAKLYDFPKHDKRDSLFLIINNKYKDIQPSYVSDIEIITADYLIKNIEESFSLWKDGNWAKHINFDEFCEYILPYKITEGQILDNWKEYFSGYCEKTVSEIYCDQHKNMAYLACGCVNNDLSHEIRPHLKSVDGYPILKMNTLTKVPYGTCDEYSILALSVMRAKGIPTAIDFTPQWPFQSKGHSWNVLLNNFGKHMVFEGAMSSPGTLHKEDHKMAKVFRRTYAINKEIEDIHESEKFIPSVFDLPFIKDVTPEYMATRNVTINIDNKNKHSYAYLTVFDNKQWQPIHWGRCKGNTVTFNNMGRDIAYLPVYYTVKGIEAAAVPFIITAKGDTKELIADTLHKQTLKLYRKYPQLTYTDFGGKRMVGAKLQASNDSLFQDLRSVHTIPKATQVEDIRLSGDSLTYRYWRYFSSDWSFCSIAELAFFEKDSVKPTYGRAIGNESDKKELAFDKTLLTFFESPSTSGAWVGMDFGEPVSINRIVCIARGDGNCVEPENEYELLYWGKDAWVSMGKKTAQDFYIEYENCPTNALFLLRNHTKGKEERIFTYENNKQIWW